jgi:hypothetical protein
MMESGDGYWRTEADYGQETVHKATLHYVEGDVGCLGLGCYTRNWCWGFVEDDQVTSETEMYDWHKCQYALAQHVTDKIRLL